MGSFALASNPPLPLDPTRPKTPLIGAKMQNEKFCHAASCPRRKPDNQIKLRYNGGA
jgi:hypothetical protein